MMFRSMNITRFIILSSFMIFNLSCEDDSPSGQCGYHTDCPIPERCIEGRCRLECRVSTDCETGARCFEGVCYLRPEVCREDSVCAPFQEVCDPRTLRCVPPDELSVVPTSTASQTMMAGTEEMAGMESMAATEGNAGMESMAATMEMAGTVETAGIEGVAGTMGIAGVDMNPPATGIYGDECNCPSDCISGFCVTNKMRRSRTCSLGCDQDVDCPGIDTCLQAQVSPASDLCPQLPNQLPPVGSIVGVCAPNETSFPCTAPSDCTSSICLTPPRVLPWHNPQPVCTMNCSSDRKCPIGYRCEQADGVDQTVCIEIPQLNACPTGDALTCGGVCPPVPGRNEADIVRCLNAFDRIEGYCSCTCATAADCPAGFACSSLGDTGDTSRPKVCIPFAGAMCPQSTPNMEQCLSTTCLVDDEDASLSRCTAFCQNSSDCPNDYECTAIDEYSVCIPREP